jgi:uncharacterized protein YjbJ (UPF0337 family)
MRTISRAPVRMAQPQDTPTVYDNEQTTPAWITNLSMASSWVLDWRIRHSGYETKEKDMNWDIVQGNWKQFRGKVQTQWGKLTDDHLDVIAGRRDELVGKVQEAYGITKDDAERQIKEFEERNKD